MGKSSRQSGVNMNKFRIFLSYSSLDILIAAFLKEQLEQCNTEVFLADQNLKFGEKLDEVFNALGRSDLIIVFWSVNSKKSDWVKREMEFAKDKNIKQILIKHNEKLKLPEYLKEVKYVKYWDPIEFDKFKKQIIDEATRLPEIQRHKVEAIVEHIPKDVPGGPKVKDAKDLVKAAEVSVTDTSDVGNALLAVALVVLIIYLIKGKA